MTAQAAVADRPEPANAPGATSIRVRGLTKRYGSRGGEITALDTVNFDVEAHQFISIVGPSGCGKSTLLMLMSGLLAPSAGAVTIGGQAVKEPYTKLGIVFQQDVLLDWRTVLQNVMLQSDIRGLNRTAMESRARELLRLVQLEGFENMYPHELSGGMRQRVSICRALLHDPDLLLMDEPFGALDAFTRDQLNIDLLRFWQETRKTIIFVTHSIPEAVFLSDRVIVMTPRPGRIEDIVSIDLPRPRRLSVRDTPEFGEHARRITSIFESVGVLRES
jgi:NitT/TauT family transport system ATP-binding protein